MRVGLAEFHANIRTFAQTRILVYILAEQSHVSKIPQRNSVFDTGHQVAHVRSQLWGDGNKGVQTRLRSNA